MVQGISHLLRVCCLTLALACLPVWLTADHPHKNHLPGPFKSLGHPWVKAIPTEAPGITLTFYSGWEDDDSRPETAWRRWVTAVGLARASELFPGETQLTLVPESNGQMGIHLKWKQDTIPGPEFESLWPTLLGPPSIPQEWIQSWGRFQAGLPVWFEGLPAKSQASFLFLQTLHHSNDPLRVPSPATPIRAQRNALQPVGFIEIQGPAFMLANPSAYPHLLPKTQAQGISGGITSDFAGGFVGGVPTYLSVDALLVQTPAGLDSATILLPRLFSQLPYYEDSLPSSRTFQAIADAYLAQEVGLDQAQLRGTHAISLAPRLNLEVTAPLLTLTATPGRSAPEASARLLAAMAELFLGELPEAASRKLRTKAELPGGAPWPEVDLNAAFCSWKGGYGIDFSSGWLKGDLRPRLLILSPDPVQTIRGIEHHLRQLQRETKVSFTASQVVPLKTLLSKDPLPRFSNLPKPKEAP